MGKRLVQQRRGRGTTTYKFPKHKGIGKAKNPQISNEQYSCKVIDIVRSPYYSAPLAKIYHNNETSLVLAPEGIQVKDVIYIGSGAEAKVGNILPLSEIPEGTLINNIEQKPGDGGKFVRASGTFAKIQSKTSEGIIVILPSKKKKVFNSNCRAAIGVLGGGGRPDKPFLKAGNKMKAMRAKNKLYPIVCGVSMNSIDHPFGGSSSGHKGRPTVARKNAPPGRKVGKIRPKRTGYKR